MKFKLFFIVILISTISAAQGTGEVIITEIYNRPPKPTRVEVEAVIADNPGSAGNTDFSTNSSTGIEEGNEGHGEWFEIYNTSSTPVVMDGWTITDGSSSSKTTTITNFTLPANSYAAFTGYKIPSLQGGLIYDYYYDYKSPSFNNESSYKDTGDTACPDGVIIKKADGTLVDEVLYDYGYGEYIGNANSSSCSTNTEAIGIPAQSSSSKVSFALKVDPSAMSAAGNDDPANWEYATATYDNSRNQKGTPGTANDTLDPTLFSDSYSTSEAGISIYPVPAKNVITIKSNSSFQISSVEVYDLLGKRTAQTELIGTTMDISELPVGIYLLKISDSKTSYFARIIKH